MKRANVWMIQAGDRLCFPLKPLLPLRICRHIFRQNLDRDVPPEPRILRAVHLAHPASSEGAHDLVWPQFRSQGKAHQLLTLVPAFYVLKEQRGKTALVRAPPRGVLMVVQKGSRQHARKLLSNKRPD